MREDTKRCEDACDTEIATLQGFDAYEEVPEDALPSWNPNARRSWDRKSSDTGQASEVTDTLWALRYKRDEAGKVKALKARCSFNGAQRQRKRKARNDKQPLDAPPDPKLETFSPTTRSTTFLLATAVAKAGKEAAKGGDSRCAANAPMSHKAFDVSGAYLQGTPRDDEIAYARPPPGYRSFDDRGIPIVWRMKVPLYGQEDAGLIWYRTIVTQLVKEQDFTQSEADPCYFFKVYANGARFDIVLNVDDGFSFITKGDVVANTELEALAKRFDIKIMHPKQFLGLNVESSSSESPVKLSMKAYIEKVVEECLGDRFATWGKLKTPCKPKLLEAYERAKEAIGTAKPPEEMHARYRTKLGKAIFMVAASVRPDLAYGVGICARCASFPTDEIEGHLDHILAYAGQTSSDGIVFGECRGATLHAYSDSDWHVAHSTSAHCLMYGTACVGYGSRRQQCISMSSTEAEIIAASQAAMEIQFLRTLLAEMGVDVSEPTVLYVDNSGAVELSKHRKSCNRSRHVLRRYLKVRELVALGIVKVEWVETKDNLSDILSKGTIEASQFDALKSKIMSGLDAVATFCTR
jgi:hypothetical protein